ncbi:hypothetical protein Hokovirus_3_154 [Hokovirus HKV1]|uniref:Uncharacterized protein n=1 Tax=Hokovirus HKV1 TaxID=1977638 RepID=A0A1V0SGT0_9VIRU|nr:hypothetical protein Hokovirus_3_154 [Hokovirus HKV1]
MFEINYKNEESKLLNRNYVYLQLLEKRLKKLEYLEKYNINVKKFSSSDNTYLEEKDYCEIKHSNNHGICSYLTKHQTIILKQQLEENLQFDKIFTKHLEKHIYLDQETHESFEKINLRYLGFKTYYQIDECVDGYNINKDYYDYIYCLDTNINGYLTLYDTYLIVFEVLDDNFDKKYIFYSNYSQKFYKTNEFIKLDYSVNYIFKYQLQITNKLTYKIGNFYKFVIKCMDDDIHKSFTNKNGTYSMLSFLAKNYDFFKNHTKNTYTKGINKI